MQTFRFLILALVLAVAPVSAQTPQRATLSANGAAVFETIGWGTASITVSGTFDGTVNFEVIGGPGTTAVAVACSTPDQTGTGVTTTTAAGTWVCPVAAMSALQARMSSYVSGAAVVDVVTSPGGGAGGSAGTFEGEVSVAAQPANDPHFVRCSDGSAANPCLVTLSGTNNITNVSGTVSLPTGASTAANQSTIIGHVDGVEAVLGTIDADTGGILTAVQLIDNAISGSEMQVDIVAPLPAGTNVIGALSANQSVNIAQIGGVAPAASACEDPAKVNSVAISTSTSGNNQLVALNGSEVVYACGYNLMAAGTVNVRFVYGTGTACATGETGLTGLYPLVAQTGLSVSNGGAVQFKGAAGNAMCIELDAAVAVAGVLTYVRQ
jgi:hypothetical protein